MNVCILLVSWYEVPKRQFHGMRYQNGTLSLIMWGVALLPVYLLQFFLFHGTYVADHKRLTHVCARLCVCVCVTRLVYDTPGSRKTA